MAPQGDKQYQELSHLQLEKRAHSDKAAREALARFDELQKSGKHPQILYSRFHGYWVHDPSDKPI